MGQCDLVIFLSLFQLVGFLRCPSHVESERGFPSVVGRKVEASEPNVDGLLPFSALFQFVRFFLKLFKP